MDSIIKKMTEIDTEIENVIADLTSDEKMFFDDEELPILVDQIVSKDAKIDGSDEYVLHDIDGNLVTLVLELENIEEDEANDNSICTNTPPVSARSIDKVQMRINKSDLKDNDSDLSLQISSEESSTEMFSLSTLDDSLSSYLIRTPGRVEMSKTSSTTTDDREGDSSRSSEFMKYDRDDSWLPDIAESTTTDNTDLDTTAEFIETPEIASTPFFAKTPSIPSFKRSGIIKSLFIQSDHNYAISNHSILQTSYDSEFYEEGIEKINEEGDDDENINSRKSSSDNLETKEKIKISEERLDEADHKTQNFAGKKFSLSSKESLEEQKQREWEIAVVRLSNVASAIPFKQVDDARRIIDKKESNKSNKNAWTFNIDSNPKILKANKNWKCKLTKVASKKKSKKTAHTGCQSVDICDINDSWNVTINEVKVDPSKEVCEMSTDGTNACCTGSCSIS